MVVGLERAIPHKKESRAGSPCGIFARASRKKVMMYKLSTSDRFCDSIKWCPPKFQSFRKRLSLDSNYFGPFRDWQCFVANSYVVVVTSIIGLFLVCCPSTVFWIIAAIIVYSFQCMFSCRTKSHIRKEIFKRVLPTLTDCYSSTTVTMKSFVVGFVTTVFHVLPRLVFCGFRHTMCLASQSCLFGGKTSTASSPSVCQLASIHYCGFSAITGTHPKIATVTFTVYTYCSEITKAFPSQIFHFSHFYIPLNMLPASPRYCIDGYNASKNCFRRWLNA